MADDILADFEVETFTHDRVTRTIYRQGTGPAVIVMAEIPGITPKVLEFARRVSAIGCTVVLPHLFGTPGRDPDPATHGRLGSMAYGLSSIVPACVSKEFTVLATGKSSPVVEWLRALARHEHERCGGPGVGAVGMCFTGGYALAMSTEPALLAPVLSQPSMPVAITSGRARNIDISAKELDVVKQRCASEDLRVLGLRFKGDKFVPASRFEFLREQLGEAFVGVELDDVHAHPDAVMPPHSVLTEHLIDEPGQPTRDALDQVLDLFREKLLVAS
jgi:dienelactone hydrolase